MKKPIISFKKYINNLKIFRKFLLNQFIKYFNNNNNNKIFQNVIFLYQYLYYFLA